MASSAYNFRVSFVLKTKLNLTVSELIDLTPVSIINVILESGHITALTKDVSHKGEQTTNLFK